MKLIGDTIMDNVNVIRNGFMAIDFSLPDSNGNMVSLKDTTKEDFVALCFFSGYDNRKIKSYLKKLNGGLPKTASGFNVNVLAISTEKVHRLSVLRNELGLSFPVLSDNRLTVSNRYYVIDSESGPRSVHFSVFIVDNEFIIRHRVIEMPQTVEFKIEELEKNISELI